MKQHTAFWFVIAVAVASLTARNAPAQIVWQNMGGGNFTNGANWVGGAVPGTNHTARFLSNATYTVTFSSSVTNNLAQFNANSGTVTLNLGSGNEWRMTGGGNSVAFNGAGGTVNLNGGTMSMGDKFGLGSIAGANNNTFQVYGGAVVAANGSFSDAYLGLNGFGNTMIVSNGASLRTFRDTVIGYGAGGSNTLVVVTGTGSELRAATGNAAAVLSVGYAGSNNELWIGNGGMVSNGTANIGGGTVSGDATSRSGTNNLVVVSGGFWTNASVNIGAGPVAFNNRVTVTNGGVVNVSGLFRVGSGSNSQSNSLRVVDGTFSVQGDTSIGSSSAASNNSVWVTGGNSQLRLNGTSSDLYVGQSGSHNSLVVSNGGQVTVKRGVIVGSTASATNNLLVVSGPGSLLQSFETGGGGGIAVRVGVNGAGNRLVIENGGMVSNHTAQVGVAGSGHSALITGGGVWTNTASFVIGVAGRDHSVTVSNNGLLFADQIFVGNGGSFNTLTVGPGGTAIADKHFYVGAATAASSNNSLVVSGAGATARTLLHDVNVGSLGSFNSLVVSNGGQVIAARHVYAGTASAAHNSILVGQGGLLEARGAGGSPTLQAGTAAGNTISNVGGVFQFTHASPTINNGGSPTKINITGGTVSFRAINNADVRVSAPGGAMNSTLMSWNGANTFMLNAASNTTASQTYTFQTGNPTNFAHLVMVNGQTAYRGGNITVGTGGSVRITNTTATVSGLFTNAGGTVRVDNAHVTWQSRVVNNGAWITDPSTNLFLSDYTVLGSGSISMSAGDVFIFKSNFVNQSTQSNTYNTTAGKFLFDSGGGQTQKFFTAALDLGPGGIYPTLPGATNVLGGHLPTNNFVLGTLELSNFSTVMVTDAFVTDGKRAGLYLENLLMAPSSLLIISNNVSVYFINSNNWTFANIVLLGDAELHQLIPEPSTLLLLAAGGAVWVWWRRRGRGNG